MPQIIPLLVVSLITTAISIAMKVAQSMITKSMNKKKKKGASKEARRANNSARENKQNITETIASLPVVYGRARLGCSKVFTAQKLAYTGQVTTQEQGQDVIQDTRGEYLYLICAFCVGEIDDFEDVFIDGVSIADPKFSSGYRVSITFNWAFTEPDPITLTTSTWVIQPYISYLGFRNRALKGTGSWISQAYEPARYFLYKIVNNQKILLAESRGGINALTLQNVPYETASYYLEYKKDSGEILSIGNCTITTTQDNANYNQSVNNNLTVVQDSQLLSEYVKIEEKRGTATQTPCSWFLSEGVPDYTANMTGNNIALLYLRLLVRTQGPDIDKAPIQGIPEITATIRGKKVLNPFTNITQYSNNPSLVLYDYLKDEKYYGCGIDTDLIDLTYFEEAKDYCDELITGSDGVTQIKRFEVNGVVRTENPHVDNIIDILEIMDANFMNSLGKWAVRNNKPETSSMTFNKDNMVGSVSLNRGEFRSKLNTINVKYIDKDTNYEQNVKTIENADFISQDKDKVLDSDLDLNLCNDFEHASYLGLVKLKTGRLDLTINFQTFWDALNLEVGDVISIDRDDFGFDNKLFRVSEIEPDNETGLISLSCVEYDIDVYSNLNIDPKENELTTTFDNPFLVQAPSNIQLKQSFNLDSNSNYFSTANFSWTPSNSRGIVKYNLEIKPYGFGEWIKLGESPNTSYQAVNLNIGKYELRIKAINNIGAESEYVQEEIDIYAPTEKPPDVQGFNISSSSNEYVLKWDPVLAIKNNGFYIIRHSRNQLNAEWNDIPTFEMFIEGYQTTTTLSQIDGTYMIKAVNSGGLQSAVEARITLDSPFDSEYTLTHTIEEHPSFSGEILEYPISSLGEAIVPSLSAYDNNLQLTGLSLWDNASGLWDDGVGLWDDQTESTTLLGVYYFANSLDLTNVYRVVLEKDISGILTTKNNLLWDNASGLWDDDSGLFDGDSESTVKCNMFVRYTRDNPSSSPAWTEWQLLTKNELVCRACQFKLEIISQKITDNIMIDELAVKVYMQNRVDQKKTTVTADNQAITFTKQFYSIPDTVSVNIDNPNTGDYANFASISKTGFNVSIKNSSGTFVPRQITSTVYGVGERIA